MIENWENLTEPIENRQRNALKIDLDKKNWTKRDESIEELGKLNQFNRNWLQINQKIPLKTTKKGY